MRTICAAILAAAMAVSSIGLARPVPGPQLAARLAEGPEIIGIVHWGLNTYTDREWEFVADGKAILRGKSIGVKRIRVLETPCTAKSCEVKVLKDGGALQGVSFKLYSADSELVSLVLSSTTESGETDTAKWMTGASDI